MSSKGRWMLGESQAAKSGAEPAIQIQQTATLFARRNYENFGFSPILKDVEADLAGTRKYRRADCAQRRGLRVRNLAGESESQVIIFLAHPPRIRSHGRGLRRGRKPVTNFRFR